MLPSTRTNLPPYARLPAIIAVMIVLSLSIGAGILHYVEDRLVDYSGDSLLIAAADIADKLDRVLAERHGDVSMLARAFSPMTHDRAHMTEYLTWMKNAYPVYQWMGVVDAQGRIVAATDPASMGRDQSDSEWFRAVRDRGGIHVRDVQASEDSGGNLSVAFTAPITGSQGKFLGAVTTRVSLPALEDVFALAIATLKIEMPAATIEYQFLNHDGDVIVDSILRQEGMVNFKLLGLPSALAVDSGQPGHVIERHLRRNVPVVTGYAQTHGYSGFPGFHWGILIRMDLSDILAPIQGVLWKVGAAGALVLGPMLGFLLWSTGRLRKEWTIAQEETARATVAENGSLMKNAELSKALQEIKVLRGFIPICMSCKKIRDDKGSWQQLESYIQKRSEALFSHGVCPDCYQKLSDKYLSG